MDITLRSLLFGVSVIALSSCGGGGQTGTEPELDAAGAPAGAAQGTGSDAADVEKTLAPSASLEVDPAFDFRVDSDVRILVTSMASTLGALNVYHSTAFFDEPSQTYYPDYASRVATWRPSEGQAFVVRVNDNWEGLLLEFVPDTADGEEQYLYFPRADLGEGIAVAL